MFSSPLSCKKYYYALVLAFTFILKTQTALAVEQKFIDSLVTALSQTRNTDDSLNTLYSLSFETGFINPEFAIRYGRLCLSLAMREKNKVAQINAYNGIGNAFETLAEFDSARHYHILSLVLSKEINSVHRLAASYSNIAITYNEQGNYEEALKNYLSAFQLGERDKSFNPKILFYIGEMYLSLGDNRNAIHYSRLGMSKSENNEELKAYFKLNIARCLLVENKIDSALALLKNALEIFKGTTDKQSTAKCLTSLAEASMAQRNSEVVKSSYREAMQLYEQINHADGICITALSYANFLASQHSKNLTDIEVLLKKGIDKFSIIRKNKDNLRHAYQLSASVYEQLHQLEKALQYQKLFYALSDSILNEKKFKQLNELQTQFETSQKEKKIAEQEISIRHRNSQLVLLAMVFVFILLFGFFFYRRNKAIQQLKFSAELQRKENEERERISKDIHDELGSGLSKIALLSSLTAPMVSNENSVAENIQSISKITSDLNDNMRDLVWTLNPNNNTLDNLFARMREYASEYLESFPVKVSINIQDDFPSTTISKEVQRNIFLVMKEALNNIVKHAHATEIKMTAQFTDSKIKIEIADNGNGFENSKIKTASNGLRNMNERITSIAGIINISSTNSGTQIKIEVRV